MKDDQETIAYFNDIVNMTADELKAWIETDESKTAGWTGGDEGGETVGHESARKIIKILESNPDKDPKKYNEDDIAHIHKVAAYCKRHLAQEAHMVNDKSEEELEKSKSHKSLKNWGHDSLKVKHEKGDSNGSKKEEEKEGKDDAGTKSTEEEKNGSEEPQKSAETGEKRSLDDTKDGKSPEKEEPTEEPAPKKTKEDDAEKQGEQDQKVSESEEKAAEPEATTPPKRKAGRPPKRAASTKK